MVTVSNQPSSFILPSACSIIASVYNYEPSAKTYNTVHTKCPQKKKNNGLNEPFHRQQCMQSIYLVTSSAESAVQECYIADHYLNKLLYLLTHPDILHRLTGHKTPSYFLTYISSQPLIKSYSSIQLFKDNRMEHKISVYSEIKVSF